MTSVTIAVAAEICLQAQWPMIDGEAILGGNMMEPVKDVIEFHGRVKGLGPATAARKPHWAQTIALVCLGGSFAIYDFIVFAFLAPVISKLFFPPSAEEWLAVVQTFGIFAAGYLFRPLGGIVMAHFGDLFGRKRLFAFSILLMSFSTLGISLLPTHASLGMASPLLLLLLRIAQGIAIGGEVPAAWTMAAEQVPRARIGLACGLVSAGLTSGILLASLVVGLINAMFSPEQIAAFAWRIPFVIGGLLALPAVYARWWLKETPVFSALKRRPLLLPQLPLTTILQHHWQAVVLSILLTWILSAGILITAVMTATLLQTAYGISPQHALFATSAGTLALLAGNALSGAITDRVGPGRSLIYGSTVFAISAFCFYTLADRSVLHLYVSYLAMGMAAGQTAAVPYVMVTAFPARVRVTGASFSYNIGHALFGGTTPPLLAWATTFDRMAPAYYLLFLSALAFGLGAFLVWRPQMIELHRDDVSWGIWGS